MAPRFFQSAFLPHRYPEPLEQGAKHSRNRPGMVVRGKTGRLVIKLGTFRLCNPYPYNKKAKPCVAAERRRMAEEDEWWGPLGLSSGRGCADWAARPCSLRSP